MMPGNPQTKRPPEGGPFAPVFPDCPLTLDPPGTQLHQAYGSSVVARIGVGYPPTASDEFFPSALRQAHAPALSGEPAPRGGVLTAVTLRSDPAPDRFGQGGQGRILVLASPAGAVEKLHQACDHGAQQETQDRVGKALIIGRDIPDRNQ